MYIKSNFLAKTKKPKTEINIFLIYHTNFTILLSHHANKNKIAIGEIIIILIIHSTHSTESWAEPKDSTPTTTTQAPTPFDQSYMNNLYMNQQQLSTKSTEDPYKFYINDNNNAKDNSYNSNNNQNQHTDHNQHNHNNYNPYNFDYSSSTTTTPPPPPPPPPPSTPITATIQTASNRPTISPFYYGLDYYKKQKTTTTLAPLFNSFATSSTNNPYEFNNFENSYFNQLQKTTSTIKPSSYYTYTTTPPTPPPAPPIDSTAEAIAAYYNSQQATTRNSVFDVYLKRLASTTKSPYNFENFGFFKSSTPNPKYSYNLFGANSNSAPNNVTSTG